ncbi:MAG: hypothetical protein ED859_14545 [Desulfuromonadales bacterium]|nr:MAG: hypothetical protein ED859_14545 [Desulfuromonadales bacterium]
MKRRIVKILCASAALLVAGVQGALALPAGTYGITVSKMNSNATLTDLQTISATADGTGKLSFLLSTLPNSDEANFIVFTIKDGNGAVVRRGIVPAPPAGDSNQVGINDLATDQAAAFIDAAQKAGSDDPILAAYLLTLLRSPEVSAADILKLGTLGKDAITGAGGFEDYIVTNGASPAKLAALKKCLIHNPDATKRTLRQFAKGFYTAVESNNATTAKDEMQKAGGLMADVFMDAAACADVELGLITNAHEAAGDAAGASGAITLGDPNCIAANVLTSIDQSMSAFNRKIGMVKMVTEYTNALNALGATGSQVNQFIAAATAMAQATAAIDAQYGEYFMNPAAYIQANGGDATTIRQAIDALYNTAWSTFQTAIASSNGEIAAMKATIMAVFPGITLPQDFGKFYDMSGTPNNWPVQQVVMVNWLMGLKMNGGSFSYTRATTPIPTMMQNWMGVCSNPQYWDKITCQNNGGTWTSQRRTYTTPSAAFNAYLGLQEDVSIAEMTKFSIWDNGNQPTSNQRMAAEQAFMAELAAIKANFVATKSAGGSSASSAEKSAVVKLMLQPQAN